MSPRRHAVYTCSDDEEDDDDDDVPAPPAVLDVVVAPVIVDVLVAAVPDELVAVLLVLDTRDAPVEPNRIACSLQAGVSATCGKRAFVFRLLIFSY